MVNVKGTDCSIMFVNWSFSFLLKALRHQRIKAGNKLFQGQDTIEQIALLQDSFIVNKKLRTLFISICTFLVKLFDMEKGMILYSSFSHAGFP